MTEDTMTLVDVNPSGSGEPPEELPPLTAAEQDTVRELVRQARASGTALTGPGGLLKQLTKMVVEAALDEEMSEHLGYDKGDQAGRNRANSRNGKRTKTVVTDNAGAVEIVVPRDRDGTFEPVIVPKRARRLSAWLFGVAHRVVLATNRVFRPATAALEDAAVLVGGPDDPQQRLLAWEELRRVAAAVDRLSEADRQVLLLVAWEELPGEQLGAALGCSRRHGRGPFASGADTTSRAVGLG